MSEARIDTRDLVDELAELGEWISLTNEADAYRFTIITELFTELADYAGDTVEDGIFLIADSDFKDYARELAEDCGMIPDDLAWPMTCIDWEQAARELSVDYTTVEFDGTTYYYR